LQIPHMRVLRFSLHVVRPVGLLRVKLFRNLTLYISMST
jgi:hypothetical protein